MQHAELFENRNQDHRQSLADQLWASFGRRENVQMDLEAYIAAEKEKAVRRAFGHRAS